MLNVYVFLLVLALRAGTILPPKTAATFRLYQPYVMKLLGSALLDARPPSLFWKPPILFLINHPASRCPSLLAAVAVRCAVDVYRCDVFAARRK